MAHVVDSIKMYVTIFVCLLVLTFVTVAVAYVDLGMFNIPLALIIATTKAALVLWFFMHLRHNDSLTKLFAVAGFFWLMILLLFTFCDYFTRHIPAAVPENSWVRHDATHFKERPAIDLHKKKTGSGHEAPAEHH